MNEKLLPKDQKKRISYYQKMLVEERKQRKVITKTFQYFQKCGYNEIETIQILCGCSYDLAKQYRWNGIFNQLIASNPLEVAIRFSDRYISLLENKKNNPSVNAKAEEKISQETIS